MGSKGDRIKGGWTINVDGYAPWVKSKPLINKIKDINYIEEKCSIKLYLTIIHRGYMVN